MDAELAIRHGPVQPSQQGVYNLSLLGHVLRMEVVGAKNGARACSTGRSGPQAICSWLCMLENLMQARDHLCKAAWTANRLHTRSLK